MCKTTTTTETYDKDENLVSRSIVVEDTCCSDVCSCTPMYDYTAPNVLPCTRKHVDDWPNYIQPLFPNYIATTGGTVPGTTFEYKLYNCSHTTPTEGCTCNGHR